MSFPWYKFDHQWYAIKADDVAASMHQACIMHQASCRYDEIRCAGNFAREASVRRCDAEHSHSGSLMRNPLLDVHADISRK